VNAFWTRISRNPVFAAAWTFFSGALGEELLSALQEGHFSFTLKSIESMLSAAAVTMLIALLHLYMPKPGTNPNP
jgi:hypothetical protein